ncbi:MAG: calcium/sodium antiporter [Bacteroidales bacterium]|nr:calcium/sodium antiporter [Bacteroidales bacterium]
MIILQILILIAGLALILFGAEILVNGASSIARKAGLSEFVIGLTIVGMGTSAPEFVVSMIGAIGGNADVAVGNVIGSNIFNSMLILGITAVIMPMGMSKGMLKRDIPINLAVAALLLILGMSRILFGIGDNGLGRLEGSILLAMFAIYIWMSFHYDSQIEPFCECKNDEKSKTWLSIIMVIGGLAGLIIGGRLFVHSATAIARMAGVSDKFIAITILAGGTSLPELATCVVAAIHKKGQLALGNILGSNVFNILLILGSAAVVRPLSFASINFVDVGALVLSGVLILTSIWTGRKKRRLDRMDGAIMLVCWAAYMTWLIIKL